MDSEMWKLMLRHREHILSNQRWVIGDGQQVQALDDTWVPHFGPLRPFLLQQLDNSTSPRVCYLIKQAPDGPTWDLDTLRTCWLGAVVKKILCLPLGGSDICCWNDEPAGTCKFKAMYNYLLPRPVGPNLPWKLLWQLPIPRKVQLFGWKLLQDRLPTRQHLGRWIPAINHECSMCRQAEETVEHLFAQCAFTTMVWLTLPSDIPHPSHVLSLHDWFWQKANKENRSIGPESAIAAPTDWWLPPPPGWLKLNFHSAFNRFTQQARVGGAICDPFGNLITTFSGDIRAAHPLEAELIALQRGLLRCHDLQLSNIQVEGDCLVLTIHYCKRSANRLADLLAKLDGPVITNSAANLRMQARGTYSNEQDRVTAYTRAFFSDLMNDASASSNAPTRVRVDPSNAIPSRGFEQGGCSYSAHHANGE
ncbi:hypothetical protein AAC387_Pa01g2436 [Persea americana]